MKFLCDRMLGTLAKWLRIVGFDTFYATSKTDDSELLMICKNENRILITRDKKLVFNARRENIKVIEINVTDIDDQIKQSLQNVKTNDNLFLSRCLLCNNSIKNVDKKSVESKVPKKVFENNEEFFYCSNCDKIYWKGSHYNNMIEKIENLT